jgi:hypothetical protein
MDIAALKEKIERLDPKAHKSLRDALSAKYRRLTRGNGEEEPKRDHTANSFAVEFAASLEEINREYLPGTIDYVKNTNPGIWKRIVAAEDSLTNGWVSGGAEEFHQALAEWRRLNRQAIEIYRKRGNGDDL